MRNVTFVVMIWMSLSLPVACGNGETGADGDTEASSSDVIPEDGDCDSAGDEEASEAASDAEGDFPACRDYAEPQVGAILTDDNLKEISGIAVSWQNRGIVWTHNDSGGAAALYAVDFSGHIRATLVLVGATNTDWEDLALMPCAAGECFYIADTGDNTLSRRDYGIYVIAEPLLDAYDDGAQIESTDWREFPIRYEDGPHNVEALAVHPNGTFYLFTKEVTKTVVFSASRLDTLGTVFHAIGELATGAYVDGFPDEAQPSLVTAADIHRNGDRLLLRTYGLFDTDNDGIREIRIPPGEPFESFLRGTMREVPEGNDIQGEAVAYDPYTGGYVHTSEYLFKLIAFNPHLYRIGCAE